MQQVWGLCAVALVACGGGRETPAEGRGTAACRVWQDSVCDWATRCVPGLGRTACDNQFQGVTCKSDVDANRCANAFDDAGCRNVPAGCNLDEIADPAPASQACDALVSSFCERSVACGIEGDTQTCVAAEGLDCSRAVAYALGYEACLDQVEEIACEAVMLPQICASVIISSQ